MGELPKNYVKEQWVGSSSRSVSFRAFAIVIILNLSFLCLPTHPLFGGTKEL
jgi:hypothetical protein